MKPELVILTTHFGTNFSGGSLATCEIFCRLQDHFSRITIIGTRLGEDSFREIRFIRYTSWWDAIKTIRSFENKPIFYGDFYNSWMYAIAGVPFYFTYHDNWPDLAKTSWKNRIRGMYYIPIYRLIFKKAIALIAVSNYSKMQLSVRNENVSLIKNGFKLHGHTSSESAAGARLIMVGNISSRKYARALRLFEKWLPGMPEIDIYGNTEEHDLARKLSRFPFVNLMGFAKSIPFKSYQALLHTSIAENLPLVLCEAIYHDLPVLGIDSGGCDELVRFPKNGKLTDDLNVLFHAVKDISGFLSQVQVDKSVLADRSWDTAANEYSKILGT